MPILHDMAFTSSKTSLEINVTPNSETGCYINIIFHFGEKPLEFKFLVLRKDIQSLYTLILDRWEELLHFGEIESLDPAFSYKISEQAIWGPTEPAYFQFQFRIDTGELNSRRHSSSGIAITIYQDRETIEQFAIDLKEYFELVHENIITR